MKRFYLIGQNIEYSLSPKIHKVIYNELNVDADYKLFSCNELTFPNDFDGLNITIPYKNEIISHLGIDKSGCKSVNTVVRENSGILVGYSTDGAGFLLDAKRLNLDLSNVLIIGSGGAAKSIAYSLKNIGNIYIKSRSKEREQEFCKLFGALPYKNDKKYSLSINCTPIYFVDNFNSAQYYDIKYGKDGQGLGMLIYQAILSDEIFLDKTIDKEIFNTIYKELKRND